MYAQVAWWMSKRTFYLEWDDIAFLQVNCMSKDNKTDSTSGRSDCSQSVSNSMSSRPTNANCEFPGESSSLVHAIHTIGEDNCSEFSTFSSGIESLNSGHAGRVWTDEIFRATRKPWTF